MNATKVFPIKILTNVAHIKDEKSLERFRQEVDTRRSIDALILIQTLINDKKVVPTELIKFIINGRDIFASNLNSFWQNIGVVAALLGAIAITVLFASLPSNQNSPTYLSNTEYAYLTRIYYIFFAIAALTEISTVIVVTIAAIHFQLMITDEDLIWFFNTWNFYIIMFPQILLTIEKKRRGGGVWK